jgi:hypothetical protein
MGCLRSFFPRRSWGLCGIASKEFCDAIIQIYRRNLKVKKDSSDAGASGALTK